MTRSAAEDLWIEGRFEGTYSGEPSAAEPGDGDARRFGLELISGRVDSVELCEASDPVDEPSGARPTIRQDRVRRVQLPETPDGRPAREQTLFEVEIRDCELRHPAEIRGRAYGTVIGRIRARLRPASPEPPHTDPATATTSTPSIAAAPAPEVPVNAGPGVRPPVRPRTISSRHGTPVEALDAETVYARLRWLLALLGIAAVAWLLARRCDRELAMIFAALPLAALALRRLLRRVALISSAGQVALGLTLMAWQLYWLGPVLSALWSDGCPGTPVDALPWIAAPVLLAAGTRSRLPMAATALGWTAAVCFSCGAFAASCTPRGAAVDDMAPGPASRPPSRTDPDGRWPAPPDQWRWARPEGFRGLERLPEVAPIELDLRDGERPGIALDGTPGGGSGLPGGSPSVALPVDATRVRPGLPVPTTSTVSQTTSRSVETTEAPGGWVAPDHRRTARDAELISIEQANRSPADFFQSRGQRRVYLPTDPIFEAGGSRLRARAGLSLTRLAALLALHPEHPVRLVIHTDSAGSPDAQASLSRRRAGVVRSWLVDRGHVDPARFAVDGVGGGSPIVPPDGSWAAQQPNRRIEVVLAQ